LALLFNHGAPNTGTGEPFLRAASETTKISCCLGFLRKCRIHVNELQINSVRGIDLAFEGCDEMEITGRMPDGSVNVVRARVVRPEVFVLIKAFALDERMKEKDAYDIAFVLHHYEPTLATLAERMRPHVVAGLGREAYEILRSKFAAVDSVGPVWAAQAVPGTGHDIEQLQRAAYEDAQELFHLVDNMNRL
jgi:hypothetical protein